MRGCVYLTFVSRFKEPLPWRNNTADYAIDRFLRRQNLRFYLSALLGVDMIFGSASTC